MPWLFYAHLGASIVVGLSLLYMMFILVCLLAEDGLEILDMLGIGQLR